MQRLKASCQSSIRHTPEHSHRNRCYILGIQVTVEIPDDLAAQVQARGLALEEYVRNLVANDAAAKPKLIRLRPGPYTPEEAARSIRESRKNSRLDGLKIKDLINEGRRL
jgi:hypothetical protein